MADQQILICGDRNWTDKDTIRRLLTAVKNNFPDDKITVIHGACRGADQLGGEVAKEFGFEVLEFPANWAEYGKAAGPIRNQQMIDEGQPTRAFAFHDDFNHSRGTKDMVKRLRNAKIPVVVCMSAKKLDSASEV